MGLGALLCPDPVSTGGSGGLCPSLASSLTGVVRCLPCGPLGGFRLWVQAVWDGICHSVQLTAAQPVTCALPTGYQGLG